MASPTPAQQVGVASKSLASVEGTEDPTASQRAALRHRSQVSREELKPQPEQRKESSSHSGRQASSEWVWLMCECGLLNSASPL